MELVSVVIPTFNSQDAIVGAIDSVLAQNYEAIEIIVVDDGSSDHTVAIAREKLGGCAKPFRVLEFGVNKGPSAARNAGWRAASGTWVQFLDSDDLLMPFKIEREAAAGASAPPDVAAVYSPWDRGFVEGGKVRWRGRVVEPFIAGKAPILCFAAKCRPLLGASLIRRSALERSGGFDEALRFWECEEACFKLAAIGRFIPSSSREPEYLWSLDRSTPYIGGFGARYNSRTVGLGWMRLILKATGNRSIASLGLPESDKRLLLWERTTWGRVLFANDREAFREYLSLSRTIESNPAPVHPLYISILSRWIGYERAEAVALLAHLPRRWAKSILHGIGVRQPRSKVRELAWVIASQI